jgi:2',3'-cyclic-nucleotide 2'-phosphodiesterase (5'-nucleotidase family)
MSFRQVIFFELIASPLVTNFSKGTFFFAFYKGGEKIAETINQMGYDGMTLGNHEFDRGDDHLGEFLNNLTFPVVCTNLVTDHPVLNNIVKPYHIYEHPGVAIIGVTTETTPSTSNPGNSTMFTDVTTAVQATIDLIRDTTNITRIAALTHIGYEEDQRLAEETTGLHLIMGGHSHTPIGTMSIAEGPYPTIKKNKEDEDVYVVTAYRWGEYLGRMDITYK